MKASDHLQIINSRVKWVSGGIGILLLALVLTMGADAARVMDGIRTWVTGNFTWYFVLMASVSLFFCIWLALGPYGNVRLGGADAKPEFSTFSWYAMLFSCGQGIGLIFWSVAEPIMLYNDPVIGTPGSIDSAYSGTVWGYFHWAIHAWAVYCVVAICLAYSIHNRRTRLSFISTVEESLPKRGRTGLSILIEVLAILATVFGLSTSFGFAAQQLNAGLQYSMGTPYNALFQSVIVVCLGVLAAISLYFGVKKGMQLVSQINMWLSILLLVAILLLGPTVFLMAFFTNSFGQYLGDMFTMGFHNDAFAIVNGLTSWTNSWDGWWTTFIWCWVFSFSPFVGGFIARISRGRTLREFVFSVVVIPSLLVCIWIAIFGGTAIALDMESGGAISAAVAENTSSGLFSTIENMNIGLIGTLLLIVATVLVGTYYITSLDSGIHALSSLVASDEREPRIYRLMLCLLVSLIALTLLSIGGVTALSSTQTAAIVGALPFSFVVVLMGVNLIKRLQQDADVAQPESKRRKQPLIAAPR